jgi:hypothetical protein
MRQPLMPLHDHIDAFNQRGVGFTPESQARSSRAKAKPGKDAGRVSSSATCSTEDAVQAKACSREGGAWIDGGDAAALQR